MAWFTYRYFGSDDGNSWSDVTDRAPHPTWRIADAVKWARFEVEQLHQLNRYAFLILERRQGSYRPRGEWKTLFEWRFGKPLNADAVDPHVEVMES